MRIQLLTVAFLFLASSLAAQISGKGYKTYNWGTEKSALMQDFKNCTPSFLNEQIQNCIPAADSLFLGEFQQKFINYRFYQNKFYEVNIDIESKTLPFVITKLISVLGNPTVSSKETNPAITSEAFILYQWVKEDTKICILKKEEKVPAWINIASVSIKSTIPATNEIDIEKMLFEQ